MLLEVDIFDKFSGAKFRNLKPFLLILRNSDKTRYFHFRLPDSNHNSNVGTKLIERV